MFHDSGLKVIRFDTYRLQGELEDLLRRSFPNEGDSDHVRKMFSDSLIDDAMDMAVHREDGKIYFAFPVAILAALKS